MKLLLFDLDGTLLRSDKTISDRTLKAINKCREQGVLIGICTSRAVHNCMTFLPELTPDLFIASGGAVVKFRDDYIFTAEFSVEETRTMISCAREICGADCEIAIDTLNGQYWNYREDPNIADATWGESIYTDFVDFSEKALKFCAKIYDESIARKMAMRFSDCDFQKFIGSDWHKFTKKEVTKESAILKACAACGIAMKEVTAFGDDGPDIGMLRICGTGVAMGNAIDAVKEAADIVIGSNDEDGIAEYLGTLADL